jgi:hypothetical protein
MRLSPVARQGTLTGTPCLPDAAFHGLGHAMEVGIARCKFRPRGRDPDHRAAVKDLRPEALVQHPYPPSHVLRTILDCVEKCVKVLCSSLPP